MAYFFGSQNYLLNGPICLESVCWCGERGRPGKELCSGGIEGLESQAKQPDFGLNSAYRNGVCISFEYLSTCRAKGQIQNFFFGGSILLKDFERVSCCKLKHILQNKRES